MGSADKSVENRNESGLKIKQNMKVDHMSKSGNKCM